LFVCFHHSSKENEIILLKKKLENEKWIGAKKAFVSKNEGKNNSAFFKELIS